MLTLGSFSQSPYHTCCAATMSRGSISSPTTTSPRRAPASSERSAATSGPPPSPPSCGDARAGGAIPEAGPSTGAGAGCQPGAAGNALPVIWAV